MLKFVHRNKYKIFLKKLLYGPLAFITENIQNSASKKMVKQLVIGKLPPTIFIETCTSCNNNCSFCPQSKKPREKHSMPEKIFAKITDRIIQEQFTGSIMLSLNNEPLLDRRIETFSLLLRKKGFKGCIGIITNGLLLSEQRAHSLFDSGISNITVNSYSQNGKELMGKLKEWITPGYSFDSKFPNNSININYRFKEEVMTNRAGNAPNKEKTSLRNASCCWPFLALPITTDGSCILCCNDFYSTTKIGDIMESSISEIWSDNLLNDIRKSLKKPDRKSIPICSVCDFKGYLNPCPVWYAKFF